jgi:hypothetical protein
MTARDNCLQQALHTARQTPPYQLDSILLVTFPQTMISVAISLLHPSQARQKTSPTSLAPAAVMDHSRTGLINVLQEPASVSDDSGQRATKTHAASCICSYNIDPYIWSNDRRLLIAQRPCGTDNFPSFAGGLTKMVGG